MQSQVVQALTTSLDDLKNVLEGDPVLVVNAGDLHAAFLANVHHHSHELVHVGGEVGLEDSTRDSEARTRHFPRALGLISPPKIETWNG